MNRRDIVIFVVRVLLLIVIATPFALNKLRGENSHLQKIYGKLF